MNVADMYRLIDGIAPFDTQAEFDNSGLLAGDPEQEVTAILLALDMTGEVIDEAAACGAQLIITHHPMMIHPIRRLTEEDREGRLLRRLARENISFIAAHTNLDQAPGGINDVLAELCGLEDVQGEGFFRAGDLPELMTAGEYAAFLQDRLGDTVRLTGPRDAVVRRVGLCSGGGSDEWARAAENGCDAFLTGELKHHIALDMADRGLIGLECGHFATEFPGVAVLAEALQNALCALKCNVRVFLSEADAYGFHARQDRR